MHKRDLLPVTNRFKRMLETPNPLRDLRWLLFALFILLIGSAYQIAQQVLAVGVTFTPRAQRWLLVIGLVGVGIVDMGVIAASWSAWGERTIKRLILLPEFLYRFRWLSWLILTVVVLVFPVLVLGLLDDLLIDIFPRLLVLSLLVFIGGVCLKALYPLLSTRSVGISVGLITTFVYHIATLLIQVTDYPFSLQ